ncbi:homeobox-leucine zipper protein HDG11-like isoform X2 [Actinidia eriantha]|nr:homeobox-leucine zipper protein HDG11-like isoform X2 [Actinidia eriantha]XP_057474360.1 homeobox-leucine zipper protein HDG11-like isoform X2 [Actinidia eriantha]
MIGSISGDEYESSNSSRTRRRPHRHSSYQTRRLEAYFEGCQHPNERQRCQLGRELGLTPTQIKFWFQNKRTVVKAQKERIEGSALREENERFKFENLAMREMLKGELCTPCKDILFSKEEQQWILEQLRMENAQLHEKYEELILGEMGILVSKVHSLPPAHGSSLDAATGSFMGQRIGGLSLDHDLGSRKFVAATLLYQLKEEQESEKKQMFQTVVNAIDELTSLMVTETLWIKDPTDGRYIIHRGNYEKTFPKISHLTSSRARFESSKAEGIVRMKGTELVGMLMNSTKRPDLFPTISTKAMTIRELGTQSGSLSGSLQLVYEQMHVLSPLVTPREFFCLRYCEQINEVEWIIVEVSYDCFIKSQQTSPFRSWRLPSGCFVKDLPNGCSKITWVEHVQVDDKALIHRLCRDFVFVV